MIRWVHWVISLFWVIAISPASQADNPNSNEEAESLDEEIEELKEDDYPDLVPADDESELMDEFEFLAEEVMVEAAAKRRQPISQSPSAISLLTREEIEAAGARFLPDALRLVPNMEVCMVSSFWYELSVRGGRRLTGFDTVTLFVDGRESTFELLGFPTWTVQHFSMDEVDRIEVIRGPGSALYGANAFSGVVTVKTLAPGEGPEQSFSIYGGEHGYFELNTRLSRRFGDLGLAVSAGIQRQDLWTGRDVRDLDLIRGRLTGKLDMGGGASLIFEGGAFNSTGGRGRSGWSEMEFQYATDFFGRMVFERKGLVIQAVYDYLHASMDPSFDVQVDEIVLTRSPVFTADLNKIALSVQHGLEVANNRLTYGAEYLFHFVTVDQYIPPERSEHRYGFFIQDELDIAGLMDSLFSVSIHPLFLTGGARFDDNMVGVWELSPRASLVWQPTPNHSFRLGYSHAFLKPLLLLTELHVELEDVLNMGLDEMRMSTVDDLANETIDSLEAGYYGKFLDGALQLKLDLAYIWINDPIIVETDEELVDYIQIGEFRIPDPSGPGIVVTNDVEFLEGHVVEMQVTTRPVRPLSLFATVGYRQFFNWVNMFEVFEPVWRLAGGASVNATQWSASLQAFYTHRHVSRAPVYPGGFQVHKEWRELPSTWWLNARVTRRFSLGSMRLVAGVEAFNILGRRFYEMLGRQIPGRPDWISERLDRRVIIFLRGNL